MTSGKIVGKTVDRIFDVEGEDGTVTQVTYTWVVEKNKSNPKEALFEIVYDSVYNNDEDSDDDRQPDEYALMKMKMKMNMHCFKIISKEI